MICYPLQLASINGTTSSSDFISMKYLIDRFSKFTISTVFLNHSLIFEYTAENSQSVHQPANLTSDSLSVTEMLQIVK